MLDRKEVGGELQMQEVNKQYFEYLMRGNMNYAWMFVSEEGDKNV